MFFIHIGQRKTGSTSLQKFFTMNAASLEAAGVCYTEVGRKGSHRLIARAFADDAGDQELVDARAALKELSAQNPDKNFLLSSESFEGLSDTGLRKIADILMPHRVRIFAYIRNFADQKVSFYNQKTKSGGNTLDFDTFFDREKFVSGGFDKIAQWSAVFGSANVRVRALDALSGEHGLINDALSFVGLSLDKLENVDAESLKRQNISYGWKVTEFYRALMAQLKTDSPWQDKSARRGGEPRSHRKRLLEACEEVAVSLGIAHEKTPYLTSKQNQQLWKEYVVQIERLNQIVMDSVEIKNPSDNENRPFLPSIERVPREERIAFAERLARTDLGPNYQGFDEALNFISARKKTIKAAPTGGDSPAPSHAASVNGSDEPGNPGLEAVTLTP